MSPWGQKHTQSEHRLITTEQMYAADQLTIKSGTSEKRLIANAAQCVFEEITKRYQKCPVLLLVGPGNNGADGEKTAELLRKSGWSVDAWHYTKGAPFPKLPRQGLIVDALFGAGLSRPLDAHLQDLIALCHTANLPIVSIDTPSGVDGDSGEIKGACFIAELTVTFFRKKPGHLLYPGRAACGEIICRDIGIADDILDELNTAHYFENTPALWRTAYPRRDERHISPQSHKYHYGHLLCVSGSLHSAGAIRLAARAGLRVGAGLVSIAASGSAMLAHASQLTTIMLARAQTPEELKEILEDTRKNVVLVGPGLGLNAHSRTLVDIALASQTALVLDADAIRLYQDAPQDLFTVIRGRTKPTILTPHAGEFKGIFPDLLEMPKHKAALEAAHCSGAFIVYKGADTVIAAPDGACVINSNASAYLATAGSGDVLAGIIAGLLAQNLAAFEASCAGVWLHGACGQEIGAGLIASDILDVLPSVLKQTFYSD